MKSFRTRLFVMASLIVAAVLAIVISLLWSSALRFEAQRLDQQLCMEARRIANRPPERRRNLEDDLLAKLRLNSPEQLMARVELAFEPAALSMGRDLPLPIDSLNWQAAKRFNKKMPSAPEPTPVPPDFDPMRPPPPPGNGGGGRCALASFDYQQQQWRAALFSFRRGRSFVAANMAAPKAELQATLQSTLKIVVPLALLLTGLGAWLLAQLSMKPVNRLRDAMKQVSQQALDQRLPAAGEDREFRELIDAYNTMLARLEASFQQASRFSADAAHELKTPLTILRGRIEQAISTSDNRAIQQDLGTMLDEVGRLSAITRKLLLLSQADAGQLALHMTTIELNPLLETLIDDVQLQLSAQQLACQIEVGLRLRADNVLLNQLLNNLLSNAVRYSRADGWIRVGARRWKNGIEITVANQCQPVGREQRQRFFERFYRGDAAHNRSIDGSGLGLSLALEIARAHGGRLTLDDTAADEVSLRLWLPAE